jgi:uncharacterized damage-inducible protein DinB
MTAAAAAASASAFAERLAAAHEQLRAAVAPIDTDRGVAAVRPHEDEWSAAEVLGHMTEFQSYWLSQVQLLRLSPGAEFGRSKQDSERLRAVSASRERPVDDLVEELERVTRKTLEALASMTQEDLAVTGLHFHRGELDVATVVETYLVKHYEEHLEQLQATVHAVGIDDIGDHDG